MRVFNSHGANDGPALSSVVGGRYSLFCLFFEGKLQTSAAPVGGDLGFQPPTRLAPEYFEAIKGQKVGFITKPVRTQMGFHVIKILGVKTYDQIDKNLYKKIIYDKKRDALIENYFKGLSKGADIKINSGL